MSIQEELGAFAKQMSENAPAKVLETMGAEIGKLVGSDLSANALRKGELVSNFELQDSEGHVISLRDLTANGSVVISFNRGNWCPFCNIEFKHLQQVVGQIKNAGANLVAISPQLPEKSQKLKTNNGFDY